MWQPLGGSRVKFEAIAEIDGYVSIGLSDDKFMVRFTFVFPDNSFVMKKTSNLHRKH